MINKYRTRPVMVDAIEYTGSNNEEINAFAGKCAGWTALNHLMIQNEEGSNRAMPGSFIIKDIEGVCSICDPETFHATYEKVEECQLMLSLSS